MMVVVAEQAVDKGAYYSRLVRMMSRIPTRWLEVMHQRLKLYYITEKNWKLYHERSRGLSHRHHRRHCSHRACSSDIVLIPTVISTPLPAVTEASHSPRPSHCRSPPVSRPPAHRDCIVPVLGPGPLYFAATAPHG